MRMYPRKFPVNRRRLPERRAERRVVEYLGCRRFEVQQ